MTNFAALMGALVKRGSWAGPTLTAKTAELGARVRFTGGALAGNEGTVIGAYGGNVVSVRLDSGNVRQKIPMERCQLVGKLPEPEIQKLREALAASKPVTSFSSSQINYAPGPSAATSTATISAVPSASVPPPAPPPPKKKAKPLSRRKADWNF